MLPKRLPVRLVWIARHELVEGVPELAAVSLEPGPQTGIGASPRAAWSRRSA